MHPSDFNRQLTQAFSIHILARQANVAMYIHKKTQQVQAAPYPVLGKSILACSHVSPKLCYI